MLASRCGGRRTGAALLLIAFLSGGGWLAGTSRGTAAPAHRPAVAPPSPAPRRARPDRVAELQQRRAEAWSRLQCRRHRRCPARPGPGPRPRPTRPPATTPPAPTTRPTTTATTVAPTTRPTTTTMPRCHPAASRCPRDLAPRLAGQAFAGAEVADITDTGTVVGVGYHNDEIIGFELPPTGPLRLLRGAPGDRDAIPSAGNTRGLVVGYAANPATAPTMRAVAWDATGRLSDIGSKLPTFGGRLIESTAWDVNERGQVVGSYSLAFDPPSPPTTRAPSTRPPDHTVTRPSTTIPPTTGGTSTRPTPTGAGPTTTAGPAPTTRPVPRTTTPPGPAYREAYLAFVWDSVADRVTVLNPEVVTSDEPVPWTTAVAIADNGIVGGHIEPAAARWRPRPGGGYVAERLGDGFVTSVNAAGDAVGTWHAPEAAHAALWPGDSNVPVVMPRRAGADPKDLTEALAINDDGTVAGNVWAYDGRVLPLRWPARAATPPELLHPDGSAVAVVRALNAAGAVAAWAGAPADGPGFRLLVWDP